METEQSYLIKKKIFSLIHCLNRLPILVTHDFLDFLLNCCYTVIIHLMLVLRPELKGLPGLVVALELLVRDKSAELPERLNRYSSRLFTIRQIVRFYKVQWQRVSQSITVW